MIKPLLQSLEFVGMFLLILVSALLGVAVILCVWYAYLFPKRQHGE